MKIKNEKRKMDNKMVLGQLQSRPSIFCLQILQACDTILKPNCICSTVSVISITPVMFLPEVD